MTQLKLPARPRRPRHPRMTYEQFLEWDGENPHVEWVNGEVVEMPSVTGEHNGITRFLIAVLSVFVEHFDVGELRHDPFQMKTGPDLPGRVPDLFFVAKRNRRRLRNVFLEGPADLAVEVISPDSRTTDRVEKFREYEQGGVREYWLIDPERRQAEFFRRGRDGRFKSIPVGEDGIFRGTVLKGLWLNVDWLWNRPPVLTVLKAWKLT